MFSIFLAFTLESVYRPDCSFKKGVRLGSVRSSHLPFKIHWVGFRAFKSPYIYVGRDNSNTFYFIAPCPSKYLK